jgi:YD repeat-containing protein
MGFLNKTAAAVRHVILGLMVALLPVVATAAVDTKPSFWASEGPTPPLFEESELERKCREAAQTYTNLVFDYVDMRGARPQRIADCYGHNVNPETGYVGQPFYYHVYYREFCPSGYGTGWQPVPDRCARVVRECPYPEVANPQSQVCEDPPCPPGSAPNPLGTACIPLADPRPRNSPPPACPRDLAAGNPIYPLRGVKREEADVGLRIGRIPFKLVYDTTLRLQVNSTSPGSLEPGVLGTGGWYSSLHRKLFVQGRGEVVQVDRGDGYRVAFRAEGSGFVPSNGHRDQLTSLSGGYRYYDAAAQTEEIYDAEGKVLSIYWASGQSVTFRYATSNAEVPMGFLAEVQDDVGRSLRFAYVNGRIDQVTDVAGLSYRFSYDQHGMLSVITLPDTRTREFLYMDSRHFWALTNVQNEYRNTNSFFGYDDAGRVVSTERPGGTSRYSVNYASPPALISNQSYDSAHDVMVRTHDWTAPSGTVLTDPLGRLRSVGAVTIQGQNILADQSQPAGAGCAASTRSQGYDGVGNIQRTDDFNGHRTCYAHDASRQLETARVEGLSTSADCAPILSSSSLPTGSRMVSTQWHPDWHLPVKLAEPGKITTKVYNGQPDPFAGGAIASCAPSAAPLPDGKPLALLCKEVEQATTDADGRSGFSATLQASVPARTTTWTYNQRGQVLTENGPRTDVNDTTTYTYYTDATVDHMPGDLATATNALGRTTQYTKYNRYGQVLESVDANGVLTVHTYDLRQRLLSTSVGGQVTGYEYDAMGRLTRVTLPDGSWTGYSYDAASRQTAVFDNRGNRTDYVLDALGNRVSETTRTAAGVQRQLSRSIDALGRVQQTTGRE